MQRLAAAAGFSCKRRFVVLFLPTNANLRQSAFHGKRLLSNFACAASSDILDFDASANETKQQNVRSYRNEDFGRSNNSASGGRGWRENDFQNRNFDSRYSRQRPGGSSPYRRGDEFRGRRNQYDDEQDSLPVGDGDRTDKIGRKWISSVEANWNVQGPRNQTLEEILFQKTYDAGTKFESYEDISVEVIGNNAPKPISEFFEAKLHPFIMSNVALAGYTKLTPVQKYAIPTAMADRDLMACAQTGSGKTAAFLLPLIQRIFEWGLAGNDQKLPEFSPQLPLAMVMAPTRELTRQIFSEAQKFVYRTPLRVCLLHGGSENYRSQMNELSKGCHLLIGTPGRITDMLQKDLLGLRRCRNVVLDEGFEVQIRQIMSKFDMPRRESRQTTMFSATFPGEIRQLASSFLKDGNIFLEIGRVGAACDTIEQRFIRAGFREKRQKLLDLLSQNDARKERHLIFSQTKANADELSRFLNQHDFPALALHGDMSQSRRERNLESFRCADAKILIATDVAARGLDIPSVKHVINFDLPQNIDDYVHRIGRTGRLGNTGLATSFFEDARDRGLVRDLTAMLKDAQQPVPDFMQQAIASRASRPGGSKRDSEFYGTPRFRRDSRSANFARGDRLRDEGEQFNSRDNKRSQRRTADEDYY